MNMIFSKKNNWGRYQVFVKCNCCLKVESVTSAYDDQTDLCMAHEWIHENKWKTQKEEGKWKQYCPECWQSILGARRERYLRDCI